MTAVQAPGRMRMAFQDACLVDDAIICGPITSQHMTLDAVAILSAKVGNVTALPILVDMEIPERKVVVMVAGKPALTVYLEEWPR